MDLEIIKIAEDTNNNKDLKNHTHHSKLKNHLCGDEIQIKLIIKNNRIVNMPIVSVEKAPARKDCLILPIRIIQILFFLKF